MRIHHDPLLVPRKLNSEANQTKVPEKETFWADPHYARFRVELNANDPP